MDGIWQAKEVLKKGYRWVLGDDKDIKIFEDAWLRGKTKYSIDSNITNRDCIDLACDLFKPGVKVGLYQGAQHFPF